MTTFKTFLRENESDNSQLIDFIKTNCKPYLKAALVKSDDLSEILGGKKTLYRGGKIVGDSNALMYKNKSLDVDIKAVRKDRAPRDTHIIASEIIDKAFIKRFDWPVRTHGVFCTGEIKYAQDYGDAHVVIPMGPIKYTWSPKVSDLMLEINKRLRKTNSQFGVNKTNYFMIDIDDGYGNVKNNLKLLTDIINELVDSYTLSSLSTGISTGHEVIVRCDKYLAIRAEDL